VHRSSCGIMAACHASATDRAQEGYLWVSSTGVFLNVDPVSVKPPLFVDVGGVPLDMLAKIRTACRAEKPSLSGGCRAVVRGRIGHRGDRNRPGIFATFIAQQF
jgi:hypothetical protein